MIYLSSMLYNLYQDYCPVLLFYHPVIKHHHTVKLGHVDHITHVDQDFIIQAVYMVS